jgi:hypothetical protein
MIIVLWILWVIACFYIIRVDIARVWDIKMCYISLEEGHVEWYLKWNIINAILNPRHFDKWTTAQWVAYQKKIVKEKV